MWSQLSLIPYLLFTYLIPEDNLPINVGRYKLRGVISFASFPLQSL